MLTKICMLLLLVFLAFLVLYTDKKGKTSRFFDLETSNCMRGFWCIIILLVHIPAAYQNPIQDAIGSFAYIGVTFFFMTSGYGLMLAVQKNPSAAKQGFWKRRLPKILIPMAVVNIIRVVAEFFAIDEFSPLGFISFNGFVKQLLFFYFVFWIIFYLLPERISIDAKRNVLYLCIFATSLLIYFWKSNPLLGWWVESFGFAYGVLLAGKKDAFVRFAEKKWLLKCAVACACALTFGVTYLKLKSIPFLGDYIIKTILGAFILLLILLLNTKICIGNAASRFLGGVSYEVYLVHDVVFIALAALFAKLDSGVFVIGSIIISVIISVLVNKLSKVVLLHFKKI